MIESLPRVTIEIARLSAALAEVIVHADFENAMPDDCELRGRLMGPRCPLAETIEVAYPLRPLSVESPNRRSARVLIPEPNLWEADSPFTYWGPVEVWLGGAKVAEKTIEVGLTRL